MFGNVRKFAPGLLLSAAIAVAARWLHSFAALNGISALMLAILLGMAMRNTAGVSPVFNDGIRFSMRRVLRLAIVLLGFQISLTQIAQVGWPGFLIVAATLAGTFVFTVWLGKRLGLDPKIVELIAAGTSICGASAIVATNTVTEARDEDVTYAVGVVTVLGTASIVLYPLIATALHMPAPAYGLWTGASIHEIAQVIAAAFQGGPVSAQFGAISKLSRVMLLAPVVFALGVAAARRRKQRGHTGHVAVPWFLAGFLVVIAVNSTGLLPKPWVAFLVTANQLLLALALGAMGLETCLRKLKGAGLRPFMLGAGAWVFIAVASLAMIRVLYW